MDEGTLYPYEGTDMKETRSSSIHQFFETLSMD
jgi:hypothetical protein